MPYGIIGDAPKQVVKNSGLYSVQDIESIKADGHWGGSLELIAEQTFSTSSTVENTSIQEDIYDIHMLYINAVGSTSLNSGIQFYESGVLESASVYAYGYEYATSSGTFGRDDSTGSDRIYTVNFGATHSTGLYIYFYNLANSSEYSFLTYQGNQTLAGYNTMFFGGGCLPQTSKVDGFRIYLNTGTITGEYKLFGIKEL